MTQYNQFKAILFFSVATMLTACGSSRGTSDLSEHNQNTIQQAALDQISGYAGNAAETSPIVQDFLDAEVSGVTQQNIDEVNTLLATLSSEEVDTKSELQAIINHFVAQSNAIGEPEVIVEQEVTIEPEVIIDVKSPNISIIGSNPVTLIQGTQYRDSGATAKDDTDGLVKVTRIGEVNTAKVGAYLITYSAIDNAKNKSSQSRVVNVVAAAQNHAPAVSQVSISGEAKAGSTLIINYIFSDADSDAESNSTISWTTPIKELQRGNNKSLIVPEDLEGQKISVWILPRDAKGKEGQWVESAPVEVIAEIVESPVIPVEPEIIEEPEVTEEPSTPPPVATSGFGASSIPSTPLSKGTIFVVRDGVGDECTEAAPCDITTARNKAVAGDVVFFRGGIYSMTLGDVTALRFHGGTAGAPITYESYPGEKAIFDGSSLPRGFSITTGIYIDEDYITIRNIEVSGMPAAGIRLKGNYNIVEGVHLHHNNGSGLHITNGVDGPSPSSRGGSFNIIRNNIFNDNSDAGLFGQGGYNDGGNADGIAVSHGVGNLISHNTIYHNSDDGIDTWVSNFTIVEYNLVYNNGISDGDGNGIKLGGVKNNDAIGIGTIARNNIVFDNLVEGFSCNHGKGLQVYNNTSYNNGTLGFWSCKYGNVYTNNLSAGNSRGDYLEGTGGNNSWDIEGEVEFISTDRNSADFLKPVAGSVFDGLGAHFR
ncbi:MAG: immunoglobulin-like domain-containing protein [Cocleimonas sp.]